MRIVAARMNHETNTFSPVPTPLSAFGPTARLSAARRSTRHTAHGRRSARSSTLAASAARARGRRERNRQSQRAGRRRGLRALRQRVVDAVAKGCDAILLDLHGAMVTRSFDDGEGELLRRIRAVAPATPARRRARPPRQRHRADGRSRRRHRRLQDLSSHRHVRDRRPCGARYCSPTSTGGPRPASAWAQLPLLCHTLRSATGEGAMQRAVERAQRLEAEGLLAVTVFAGFGLADIRDAGMSVVVTRSDSGRGAERRRRAWAADLERSRRVRLPELAARRQRGLRARPALERGPGAAARPRRQRDVGRHLRHDDRARGVSSAGHARHRRRSVVRSTDGRAGDRAGVGARVDVALGNKLPLGPAIEVRAAARRERACPRDHRRPVQDQRSDVYRRSRGRWAAPSSLESRVFHRGGDRAPDGAARPGRVRKRRRQPAPFRFPDPQVADVLPPEFRAAFVGAGRVRQRRRHSSNYALFPFRKIRRPIYPLDPQVLHALAVAGK